MISPLQQVNFDGRTAYLKRDDMLELGCSKQRSIIPMMEGYVKEGVKKFVVSSSGNAALCAVAYAQNEPAIEELLVLLSEEISETKKNAFKKYTGIDVNQAWSTGASEGRIRFIPHLEDPRREAIRLGNAGYMNLRGSTDENAVTGFESIANELLDQVDLNNISSIFIPASSGTTAYGVFEGLRKLDLVKLPQVHVVQTTKVHSLLKRLEINSFVEHEEEHPSESIVDIIGYRRHQIEYLINFSGGKGWIISSAEVVEARYKLSEIGIACSYDSALAFAAFKKSGLNNAICLFTG